MSRAYILSNLHTSLVARRMWLKAKVRRRSDAATTIGVHVCSTLV